MTESCAQRDSLAKVLEPPEDPPSHPHQILTEIKLADDFTVSSKKTSRRSSLISMCNVAGSEMIMCRLLHTDWVPTTMPQAVVQLNNNLRVRQSKYCNDMWFVLHPVPVQKRLQACLPLKFEQLLCLSFWRSVCGLNWLNLSGKVWTAGVKVN